MHATIIKFNSLPDTVWSATKDDHLLLVRGSDLIFLFIGGIIVRGIRLKFSGAGVNQFVNGFHSLGFSYLPDILFIGLKNGSQLNV